MFLLFMFLDVFDSKLVVVGDNGYILILEDNGEYWE